MNKTNLKKNFLKTSDESTKNQLIKCGLQLVDSNNGIYTFINDSKLFFNNKDTKNMKVTYSNMLTI